MKRSERSNQALERTATRCVFTLQMIKTVSLQATLALGGGRSSWSLCTRYYPTTVPSGSPVQWTRREFAVMGATMLAVCRGRSTRSKQWRLNIHTLRERGTMPDLDYFESL